MSNKVVAFLQCQWFKDPVRAKQLLAMYEEREADGRERFIRDFLFFGCLTGKRLDKAFEDEKGVDTSWRYDIVWEETSKDIGGKPSQKFPADFAHIRAVIAKHKPVAVLALGKVARHALTDILIEDKGEWHLFAAPHPAARGARIPGDLKNIVMQLKSFLAHSEK